MNNFIKLSSRIINKLHIIEIIKKPNKYEIHMNNSNINGYFLFSSCGVEVKHNIIEICDTKDKKDYKTITKLIKQK